MRLSTSMFIAGSLASVTGACSDDPGIEEPVNCATVTNDDDFVIGVSKPGEQDRFTLTLMSAAPAVPVRDDNTWIFQVTTMAAPVTPVVNAGIIVLPTMPAHGHPAGKDVIVTPLPEPGQYKFEPVNTWMAGVWEIEILIDAPSEDRAVFRFCVPS